MIVKLSSNEVLRNIKDLIQSPSQVVSFKASDKSSGIEFDDVLELTEVVKLGNNNIELTKRSEDNNELRPGYSNDEKFGATSDACNLIYSPEINNKIDKLLQEISGGNILGTEQPTSSKVVDKKNIENTC